MAMDYIFQGPPTLPMVSPGTLISPAIGLDSVNGVGYLNSGKGWVPQIPATVAKVDLTAQQAAISTTTAYTVPGHMSGRYRVGVYSKATQAATTSSTLGAVQIGWTDNDDSTVLLMVTGSSTNNSTLTVINGEFDIYAKGGTNITYAEAYASSGATPMQYNLHIRVDYLG